VLAGAAAVFVGVFVFFASVHSMVPFSGDDWRYLSEDRRLPLPLPFTWNPTRVLPEIVMPLAGRVAAFVVAPLTGDYLSAAGLTTAVLLAGLTAGLYVSLYRLFLTLHNHQAVCALLGVLTIGLFFALLKRQPTGNPFLFHSPDLCSLFFYAVPNLMNSILLCVFFRWFVLRREVSVTRVEVSSALWLTVLYLGIFSMQFSAMFLTIALVFLAVFRFTSSPRLEVAGQAVGQDGGWKRLWCDTWSGCNVSVLAAAGMAVALVFELTGGRAHDPRLNKFSDSISSDLYLTRMGLSFDNMGVLLLGMNPFMAVLVFGLVVLAAGLYLRRRKQVGRGPGMVLAKVCAVSALLLIPYYMLVAAWSHPWLIRADVMYGFFFLVILLSALSGLYVLRHVRVAKWFLPLAVLTVLVTATNSRWTLADPFAQGQRETMNASLRQIMAADRDGETTVTLPALPFMADWTQSVDEWSQLLSRTLYLHHVTSREMTIVVSRPEGEHGPLRPGQRE